MSHTILQKSIFQQRWAPKEFLFFLSLCDGKTILKCTKATTIIQLQNRSQTKDIILPVDSLLLLITLMITERSFVVTLYHICSNLIDRISKTTENCLRAMGRVTFAQANICKISSLSSKFLGFILGSNNGSWLARHHTKDAKVHPLAKWWCDHWLEDPSTRRCSCRIYFTIFKLDLCDQQQSTLPYSSSV